MSDFVVTVPTVEQTSVATRTASAELGAELARLRRDVDAVLTGQWRGVAATAFDRAWGEWHAGARDVVDALDRLAELLAEAGRAYAWSDDSGASALQRLAPALPAP